MHIYAIYFLAAAERARHTDHVHAKEGRQQGLLNAVVKDHRESVRAKKGKAVGQGGISKELLQEVPDELLEILFEAMMRDIRDGTISEDWRTVLYVLLIKPERNPDVVSDRREIALMAQEMKLLLGMLKRTCYNRVANRIVKEQAGWVSGMGAFDPGLALGLVVQQARRMKQPLYLLFIDLKTFFPTIHREALKVAELWHGIPEEVADLALMIYGAASGEGAVQCQFDTAAGLTKSFGNPRGALMGCTLSPDKAKIFLNSIVGAITLTARGVRVWGWGDAEQEKTWEQVCHVAFADDWCGAFTTAAEARYAWSLWKAWEPISGSQLGVLKQKKTVLTGVGWSEGDGAPFALPWGLSRPEREETDDSRERAIPDFTASQSRLRDRGYGLGIL